MATSTKAPLGQRLVAAVIALFCVSVASWLLYNSTSATWYIAVCAVLVLCVACVFGHVSFRGKLPGRFLAGGNAFIGGGASARINGAYVSAPIWQRVICAVLAVGGSIAVVAQLVAGGVHPSHHGFLSAIFALGGVYLFGHVAWRGHLPGRYADGGNTSSLFHNRGSGS